MKRKKFNRKKYEEVADSISEIYDELDRGEELLVTFAAYKYKSLFGDKFKDWTKEDFKAEFDCFYPEASVRLDNAVTYAEDIVFDYDEIDKLKNNNKNEKFLKILINFIKTY